MRLRVLGCSGAELPNHNPSSFLLDETLLLDGGTIGAVLGEEEQWRIKDILVTHSHLDHVRGIPNFADNIVTRGLANRVNLIGTAETLNAIRSHLLNRLIWPDFTLIPSPESPILSCREIVPEEAFRVQDYLVTAFRVNHTVPAVGYRISKGDKTFIYTGDTGPTDRIWQNPESVSALVVEVSLPNGMEETAHLTGHMTPALLAKELTKLGGPPDRILVTHLKPQYWDRIRSELGELRLAGLELLQDGAVYEL